MARRKQEVKRPKRQIRLMMASDVLRERNEALEALRPFALLGWALGPRDIYFPHMETIHRPMHIAGRDGRLVEVTGAQALTAYEVWCKANPGQEP